MNLCELDDRLEVLASVAAEDGVGLNPDAVRQVYALCRAGVLQSSNVFVSVIYDGALQVEWSNGEDYFEMELHGDSISPYLRAPVAVPA